MQRLEHFFRHSHPERTSSQIPPQEYIQWAKKCQMEYSRPSVGGPHKATDITDETTGITRKYDKNGLVIQEEVAGRYRVAREYGTLTTTQGMPPKFFIEREIISSEQNPSVEIEWDYAYFFTSATMKLTEALVTEYTVSKTGERHGGEMASWRFDLTEPLQTDRKQF